jgi:tyrosyl-tRNA synthetase
MTHAPDRTSTLLEELAWRELLYQQTDGLENHLKGGPVAAYCGFDATGPSLHVGHLVPVMALVRLQRHGHRPIALVGDGTAMIGDPSGRSAERPLQTEEVIDENARQIHRQLERFLDFSGPTAARMRKNGEWLRSLAAIEFMRDVGKHFTVNYMMAKESVKARLDAGISYTEFSYMLLQAYDYLELHRREGVTLQVGGSDQWGNITAGMELIRRIVGREAHALTLPLVTTATGAKFGKTEAGTSIWLDARMTSPYKFYQFWINTDDRDVGRYLRYFTLLERETVETLDRATMETPERREAQQTLARDVTSRAHGEEAARAAAEVSALLFGKADPEAMSAAAFETLRDEVPFAQLPLMSADLDVLELFTTAGLTASKGAGKRLLEQGGMYVNGRRLSPTDRSVGESALLEGKYLLLRKGAREYALVALS